MAPSISSEAKFHRFRTIQAQLKIILETLNEGGMPWPKTGITHYQAQLGFLDKRRAIKQLGVT